MIVKIYPKEPNEKLIAQIVQVLRSDGVIIYPTDSVYAFGCSVRSAKALERIKTLKGKRASDLSIVCADLSTVAEYARVDNHAFRILKHNLPGAFTFILQASSKVPDRALGKRKFIGVRIPANPVTQAILGALGSPLATTSVRGLSDEEEYTTDPELIHERWGGVVDLVVDGGPGDYTPTTLVDLSDTEPVVLREGRNELKL